MKDDRYALIISPEDFPVFLKSKMGDRTVDEFAEELDVSRQFLYLLLSRRNPPSKAILAKLNLTTVYALRARDTPKSG